MWEEYIALCPLCKEKMSLIEMKADNGKDIWECPKHGKIKMTPYENDMVKTGRKIE